MSISKNAKQNLFAAKAASDEGNPRNDSRICEALRFPGRQSLLPIPIFSSNEPTSRTLKTLQIKEPTVRLSEVHSRELCAPIDGIVPWISWWSKESRADGWISIQTHRALQALR
jgi:hypothetical protein